MNKSRITGAGTALGDAAREVSRWRGTVETLRVRARVLYRSAIVRNPWTWVAVSGVATAIMYPVVVGWFTELRPSVFITLSSITLNLILFLASVGYMEEQILWMALDKYKWLDKDKKWGKWKRQFFVWAGLIVLFMVTMLYLKLWGYEMRF